MNTEAKIRSLQLGMHWFPERAGGLDRVYYELYRHLGVAGVDFRGLVAGSDRPARESDGRVQVFSRADAKLPWRLLGARRAIRQAIAAQRPDLLVAHFALYAFPALDSLARYPFVMHFHGPWAMEVDVETRSSKTAIQHLVERAVCSRADRLIVLSEAFREILHERYGVPEERIRLVPGGVDSARFRLGISREQARQYLGLPQDRPIVIAVRRLVRRMGLEDLLDAVPAILQKVPDALVLIAGKGTLTAELQQRIKERQLEQSVRLLGFVPDDDLPYAYRAANLSVVPSVALEGFGLITAESLAAGTPVLVTPVGGLPEVVRNLSADLVLPATGTVALAEGICAALRGELALPDASACERFAVENYDWGVIARKTRSVYEEAIR